jgi:hypothetical protein
MAIVTSATCAWLLHCSPTFAQTGSGFEIARTSLTSVHYYVASEAIPTQLETPANLSVPGLYQPLVDSMLRRSPTFRRQCMRIAGEPMLTVRLAITQWFVRSGVRATTVMRRNASGHLTATIEISAHHDLEELIAHELEHVIEQLDGVDLHARARRPRSGVSVVSSRSEMFETVRAHRAGLKVVAELRPSLTDEAVAHY